MSIFVRGAFHTTMLIARCAVPTRCASMMPMGGPIALAIDCLHQPHSNLKTMGFGVSTNEPFRAAKISVAVFCVQP
jgi:hypothetical protein